jgi:Transposase, Mutator family
LAQLTKRLVKRAMEVELTDHLGYEPHQEPPGGAGNARNGCTPKTLITDNGPVPIDTPRDRDGSFAPQIVRKRQRRFQGFDDKILALYSRGLSVRDIEAHLQEIYGVKVGRDLISRVTDAVMEDVRAWQQRPLDDVYPVILPRRAGAQDPRGRQRPAPRLLSRARPDRRRRARRARAVVWGDRGRQVLDAGPDRAQAARRARHPDLLRRRPHRLAGGDQGDLPRRRRCRPASSTSSATA